MEFKKGLWKVMVNDVDSTKYDTPKLMMHQTQDKAVFNYPEQCDLGQWKVM